uniref:Obscurin, cytoskeletal calmodulin and titin-interacting RhoGEF a n=1 Tax=Acanthochromis polyacanthus TaxID=80966 RepID=A0A3Q1FI40_9TELE
MKTFISQQLNPLESSHHVPVNVLNQKEIIFRNVKDIVLFHESVLPGLRECSTDDDVAMHLIKHSEDFEKYLHYMVGQQQAEACISDKAVQQHFKDAAVMDVLTFLQQPVERIQTYQALLKELIKNKAKSGQSCYLLEDAFSIVSCLPWRSDNVHQVSLIDSYPAPLTALGEPVRQGVFTVWEESPEIKTTSRGHQRQVFLFKECIVLCKLKKDSSMNRDTFSFKNKMKLNDVEIKETVGGEEKSFGLWHEHRGSMRRYTLQGNSTLVKLSWLKDLKELQPPVFDLLLSDCTTKIGQTIKLTCKVSGSPKPLISWLKGLPLEDDPRHIISADRSGCCSLILDSLTAEDSGQYACYASSSMGSAGTLAKVAVQPPRFVSRLESACLIEGEDIQFFCSTLTTPLPRVWLKDGRELTDQQKYSIMNDPRSGILSLTVIGATEADIGQYECELWNEFGCIKADSEGWSTAFVKKWLQTDFSPTSIAKMLFPPEYPEPPFIQVPAEDLCVEPGQTSTFTAIITGRPAPKIQWFKDGEELAANENVKILQQGARCSVTIACPEGEDSGVYTCFAHNYSGHASCQAQLTVEELLEIQEREVELGKRRKLFSVYDVHEEIGGTFGVVKRVIHRRTGEVFAAKFLPLRSSTRTRAFQERDLLSRLAHPRVACLLDFFCTRRTLVLITECCSHGLLDHLLLRGSVSEKEVQSYIQQILEGVGHIHSMNILHLDIKQPDNILMVYPPRDEIKICDFGFCQEIDTSRHQYSLFGTPEFVAPEIVHQEPVTVATDVAVGVIAYLLVSRCPFVGDTDRATLLRVGEGTLNWDAPDIMYRSPEAKNFLHSLLQPDPKRPSAFECLSHEWFQDEHVGEDTDEISTKSLRVFISKRKWQRSLTCIGSVLTLRPIPELLDAPLRDTAATVPREPQEHSSSSPSSGSSSEYDEADSWDFFQHCSQTEEEEETEEDFDPLMERAQIPEPFTKLHLDAEEDDETTLGEEEDVEVVGRRSVLERSVSRQSVASSEVSFQQTPQRERRFSKDSSPSLCLSDGDEGSGSDGGRIPRGSLIRSTFYNTSHQLSPMSARHMTLRDKFQAKKQERGRKPLRRSFSGRLNEPLIEYVEDETETNRGQRRASIQPSMQKSCSFDSGVGLVHANAPPHRRSRSLDESRRSPSSPGRAKPGQEEGSQSLKEDFTDDEEAGRKLLAIPSPQRPTRRGGSVAPVQGTHTVGGSSVPSSFIAGNRMRLDQEQTEGGTFTGSQGSLAESFILEHGGSESSGEWTVLSEEVTESCYVVKDLPTGASYVFRVGCISKRGAGPFSDASAPVVMATHPEIHIPLIQTQSLGSKGTGSTTHKNFSFLSEINGRFSVVTVCRDVETSQVFAAKITPYQAEQRQLVLREYQLLKRLHHPHLVQLHTAIITPCYMVLVEELCPGKELLYSLAADLYAETHVAELLVQILGAVDYLHSRRVIHLDLKSDNMLVDDNNHVKIVDLGSAQSFTPGQPLSIEHIQGMSDSRYIVLPKAPEILEGQGVGPETDVWAIGVLSFILSADSPFHAEHGWEQDKNIKKGKIQFGRCYPGLSEGALTFMKSSLNNKSGRPTAAECLQNLWIRTHRAPHKAPRSKVCFSTDKLKAFLKQKEEKRDQVRIKLQGPFFQ